MPRAAPRRTPHRGPAFVDIPLDAFGPGYGRPADGRRRRCVPRRVARPRRGRTGRGAGRGLRPAGARRGRRRVLGARGGSDARASSRRRASRCSSTAWGAARCPPTTSSRSRAPLGRAEAGAISCSSRERRSTSGLGFGRFGDAQVVHLCDAALAGRGARHARGFDRRRSRGDVRRAGRGGRAAREARTTGSRVCATTSRRSARPSCRSLEADTTPIKPARIYGELAQAPRPRRDRHR